MSNPFIGEIRPFGFNYAPRNWAVCDGQILSISLNSALFSLIGTYYGGNGATTFGLPDLRGRTGIHQGQGPGLSSYVVGETNGVEQVTLLTTEVPAHAHAVPASSAGGATRDPRGAVPGTAAAGAERYAPTTNGGTLGATALGPAGSGFAHPNRSPYLTLLYCIAVQGVYPSRN